MRKKRWICAKVIVRAAESFSKIANRNPLLNNSNDEPKQHHVTFFNSPRLPALFQSLEAPAKCYCKFNVGDQAVFIEREGQYKDAKLNNAFFESRLKVACTARNENRTCNWPDTIETLNKVTLASSKFGIGSSSASSILLAKQAPRKCNKKDNIAHADWGRKNKLLTN